MAEYINSGIIQYAQLHGDEDNLYIDKLMEYIKTGYGIIKAVRVRNANDVKMASGYNCNENVIKPFFLAGGISAGNVEAAIKTAAPYAVDASSSMETSGYKDFNKMKEFVDAVRRLDNI